MSDDEVIKFEITDYDLDNEFNPGRGRKANKEQQIYGVWAKDSDDDENEDNVRQRIRKPKDFSAPIGFVAGGVQQAGKKKDKTKVIFNNLTEIKPAEASTSAPKYSDSSDEEPEVPVASDTAGIRRQGQGMRPPSLGGNVGNWEKHTKGIGAKLLLQMGYQPGKGLGKDLQGISAPVEATLRKGRGAIGAYGPEKATIKAKKEEERRIKDKEDQDKDKTEKNYNWKKSHKGRYFYRDAADVIQEGKPTTYTIASNELSRVPVIDMTGKEKRVLSGYHALRAQAPRYEHEPRRKCQNFSAPQLVHNLEVMVECCEQDIIQNARELQQAEDEIVVLERDIDECDQQLKEHDEVIGKVQAILEKVEELNKPDVSLEKAHQVLASLKTTGHSTENEHRCCPLSFSPDLLSGSRFRTGAEYEMLGLGTIAGNIVSPLLSALLATWSPLENPEEPLPVFVKWKQVLTEEAFNSLLWQHYVPHISNAVESWNPRTPEPMVQALTSWRAVCPAWLLSSCASRYVVSRVLAAVRVWDPTRDTQPVHQWVLPWHELAGNYPRLVAGQGTHAFRRRLGSRAEWWYLPARTHKRSYHRYQCSYCGVTAAWQWCVEWREVAGAAALGALAGRTLLARWLAALAAWLNTNPPHATVINSYTEFKKMFPEDILKEPAVRDAFRKALDMMNRSADIDTIDPPPPPRFTVITETKETPRIVDVLASATQQKSFSELLETRCIENGITFVPIAGKTREGRPLYKIGALQCYVIRNVIMYSDDNGRNFAPIAIDKLLKLVED
ncbi:septin and tuftelin interacting protein [Bombyx mori]|uniref:STIP n=1 Tax=Bombyx mori TaxID=7091 RepID=A1XDB3_BOMMO|nr:septin and tuftelin interacting protein [Bombyx mori]ABC69938.1 STIP [Bombyx mori]